MTTSYTYDNINRLTAEQRNGQTIGAYTYTANGQKATITDVRGTTSYTYRPEGQLARVLNPDGSYVNYLYEGAELRSVITPYDTTTYTYDTQGRLKTTTAHGETTTYIYDLLGNQIGTTFANGVVETRSYDNLNRLTNVNQAQGGNVLANYAYTLDAVGNKVKVVENDRTVDFSYDTRDRLTQEIVTAGANVRTTSYTYDAVSNRLSKNDSAVGLTTYAYSANDRLLSEVNVTQTTAYTYDANGNNQTKTEAGNLTTYSWNADNRIVGIDTNNHTISYEYDRAGMRTSQTVDGVRTNYLLDVSRENPVVVAEYSSGSTPITTYTYGGNLISQKQGSDESFFLMDGHSGVRVLTDRLGNLTDTGSYDAYGNAINPLSAEFGYRGESFDDLTGLQYLRARYYEPSTGRFLGVDPFEGDVNSPVSRHRYLYGNANPVTYSDPSGKFSLGEQLAILSIYSTIVGLETAYFRGQELRASAGVENEWTGTYYSFGFVPGGFQNFSPLQISPVAGWSFGFMVLETTDGSNYAYTKGLWAILGAIITVGPIPLSATTSSATILSPETSGTDVETLSGGFITFGIAAGPLPFFGSNSFSFTMMGLGVGKIDYNNLSNNISTFNGFDYSVTGFTGLSIPIAQTNII